MSCMIRLWGIIRQSVLLIYAQLDFALNVGRFRGRKSIWSFIVFNFFDLYSTLPMSGLQDRPQEALGRSSRYQISFFLPSCNHNNPVREVR